MKLNSYTVKVTLHPRTATGAHSSDTREETTFVNAHNRPAAKSAAREAFERSYPMPYGFALTFLEVNRVSDTHPWLRLSEASSYRGASMGRVSVIPQRPGDPMRFHLLRVNLDSGGYDAGGAYWGFGKPLYRAVSSEAGPVGVKAFGDITALSGLRHAEVFTRADSRAEAKELIRDMVPGALFYR